jgi:hypothetical protein
MELNTRYSKIKGKQIFNNKPAVNFSCSSHTFKIPFLPYFPEGTFQGFYSNYLN